LRGTARSRRRISAASPTACDQQWHDKPQDAGAPACGLGASVVFAIQVSHPVFFFTNVVSDPIYSLFKQWAFYGFFRFVNISLMAAFFVAICFKRSFCFQFHFLSNRWADRSGFEKT
jgi:hypothetical protein